MSEQMKCIILCDGCGKEMGSLNRWDDGVESEEWYLCYACDITHDPGPEGKCNARECWCHNV